jgi:hypothetical protein
VFFVADVSRSLHFHLDSLGFHKKWHEADGAGTVCQVDRSDCEIILCQDAARHAPDRLCGGAPDAASDSQPAISGTPVIPSISKPCSPGVSRWCATLCRHEHW